MDEKQAKRKVISLLEQAKQLVCDANKIAVVHKLISNDLTAILSVSCSIDDMVGFVEEGKTW